MKIIGCADVAYCLLWFVAGAIAAIPGWLDGESLTATRGLMLTTSQGLPLTISVYAVALLAVIVHLNKGRTEQLAYGDFRNIVPWCHKKLQRAVFALLGFALTADTCWFFTHSGNALKTSLNCLLLSANLLYQWYGLAVIDDAFAQRLAFNHRQPDAAGCSPASA